MRTRLEAVLLPILLIFLSLASVLSCLPASAEEAGVFRQAFSIVMDNYVDQPDPAYLASSAVAAMEGLLRKQKREIPEAALDYSGIAGDRKKAEDLVIRTYAAWLKATGVNAKELETAAVNAMIEVLDPHSTHISAEAYEMLMTETGGAFGGVGLEIAIKEKVLTVVSPIEDAPAFRAGLKPGDQILRIDGRSTEGFDISQAVRLLRGEKGKQVTLAVMRQGFATPRDFSITRDIILVKSVKSRELEEGIGYLRISAFTQTTARDMETALNRMGSRAPGFKGLVLDLRNNPGGLLNAAVEVADKFIDAGKIVTLKGRTAQNNYTYEGKTIGTQPLYPVIVLINEGSASASEIVAGALQDRQRGVIVGARTFGKGSVQTIVPLSDKSAIRLTTAKYYLPSGKSVEAGITPDLEIAQKGEQDLPLLLAQSVVKKAKLSGILGIPSAADRLKKLTIETAAAEFPAGPGTAVLASKPPAGTAPVRASASEIEDVPKFASARKGDRAHDLAVIIGIEKYQNVPSSEFSSRDARLVKEYLKAIGFQERNIELITDERATYSGIRKAVETWVPNRAAKNSRIFIYFSGHGSPEASSGEAYLLPFDGDPNYLKDTGYPLKRLYERMGKLDARETIVVLDSCFSGAGGRSVLAKGARPLVMLSESKTLPSNLAVLTASGGNQISTSSPEKQHGVFTYYFLKALKDGKGNLAQIYEYILPLIENEAKALNVMQVPSIRPEPAGLKNRFVLVPAN